MTRTIQALVSLVIRRQADDEGRVHFHQGPQGQPVPCFDEACPNPRLWV